MKISKKATSIIEALVVTLIIVMWLTWVYSIFSKSINLTIGMQNKIQAIQIAREWIEAITNIRDTNWLLFPSNTDKCWKTFNYDSNCLYTTETNEEIWEASYRVYKDSNYRWILEKVTNSSLTEYSNVDYRNFYNVSLDSNLSYTQTWAEVTDNKIKQNVTREIRIESVNAITDDVSTIGDWLKVTSIVQWKDSSSTAIRKVEIESILTNYNK